MADLLGAVRFVQLRRRQVAVEGAGFDVDGNVAGAGAVAGFEGGLAGEVDDVDRGLGGLREADGADGGDLLGDDGAAGAVVLGTGLACGEETFGDVSYDAAVLAVVEGYHAELISGAHHFEVV